MSTTTEISLPCGRVTASVTDENLIHARGIPYATATRFEVPQPTEHWQQAIDCTKPASICAQLPSRLESVMGPLTQGHPMSENCLHVSVVAPRDAQGAPVLVWLHGGAYISGGGDLDCYRPTDLAQRGIVCVNVTYRLGVFGYLQLDGIAPANLGLLDQIAALRWVQKNIAAFGGDPSNITLTGQSAGGDSILCMMIAEGTEGLFQRAILLSPPVGELQGRTETETALSEKAMRLLTKDPREMATAEILELQKMLLMDPVRRRIMLFAPTFGAFPLPAEEHFGQMVLERSKNIPILVGWVKQDGRPFAKMVGPLSSHYSLPYVGDVLEALGVWYMTRAYFSLPCQRLHEQLRDAGHRSTTYSFGWRADGNPLESCHCIDIPFVMGTRDSWLGAPMLEGKGAEKASWELGQQIKELWVRFARGGELRSGHIALDEGFVCADDIFIT
ncbi:hypothetical protein FE257_000073 [Aspergillus nanangensis]|uniref:Carboxylic ester hydrolase n=1 Tax=Aspergillus nanangensis TaxID=2582783 RepID=A0AAD4CYQ3_ASPNN|nr:hypothetical protein FE257_000073 [Aspergillus nanangensis]